MQENIQDVEIIQRILKGQQQAFSILVERYQHFVFTIVLRLVNNREEAEELSQDIFVKAYRFLADFKHNSKFSTWLYTIAHNTCLSFLRKKQQIVFTIEEEAMNLFSKRDGNNQSASTLSEERSRKKVLIVAIQKLSQQDAELITLFYMAEQSIEEIATIIGADTNNVKVKLFRARQKLKIIIEKFYCSELNYLS